MKQSVNLLPYHEAPPRDWLSFRSVSLILAGLACALGIAGGVQEWRYSQARQQLEATQQEASRLQQQADALAAAFAQRNDNPAIVEQQHRLEKELAMKQRLIQVIEQLNQQHNEGFSAYLSAMAATDTEQTWLTGILINSREAELTLTGQTLHPAAVATLLGELARQPALSGYSFAQLSLEAVSGSRVHRFVAQGGRYQAAGESP